MGTKSNGWSEHLAHLRSRPSGSGLDALARAVSKGSSVVRIRRLGGGLGSANHLLVLQTRSGRTLEVVLKRFRPDDDPPTHEWQGLAFAQRLNVPSPAPVAFDKTGEWFGAPALVMTRLPGRAELNFADPDALYEQIAFAAVTIAATSTRRLPAYVARPMFDGDWNPPAKIRRSPLSDRAIAKVRALMPRQMKRDRVIGHNDLHPGNMLWTRQRLTGLVDWSFVNLTFPERDAGYCCAEIAVLRGVREAERFLDIYTDVSSAAASDVRFWSLVQAINALRWVKSWAYAYREQGRRDLTDELAVRRAAAFVRHTTERL